MKILIKVKKFLKKKKKIILSITQKIIKNLKKTLNTAIEEVFSYQMSPHWALCD